MGKHVLLIEDEPNIIEAISFILSRDGWKVDTHSNGQTAMNAVREKGPDLVILDVMLPEMSGYDILKALRSEAENRTSAGFDADRTRPEQGPRNGREIRRQPVHDQTVFPMPRCSMPCGRW